MVTVWQRDLCFLNHRSSRSFQYPINEYGHRMKIMSMGRSKWEMLMMEMVLLFEVLFCVLEGLKKLMISMEWMLMLMRLK